MLRQHADMEVWFENSSIRSGLAWHLAHVRLWRAWRVLRRFESWDVLDRSARRAVRGGLHGLGGEDRVGSMLDSPFSSREIEASLRQNGCWAGLQLPDDVVDSVVHYARVTPCRQEARGETFLIDDLHDGRTSLGTPIAIADVDARGSDAVEALQYDGLLRKVAGHFLGYPSTQCLTRLYWSPAVTLPVGARRRAGQTIDYHYDIERRPTLYVYFYLTHVDRERGAHVVVKGSHRRKPLSLKLASTRQRESRVLRHFPEGDVTVIEGRPGLGFFEDPACYHKVLAPASGRRLMLQLRFS